MKARGLFRLLLAAIVLLALVRPVVSLAQTHHVTKTPCQGSSMSALPISAHLMAEEAGVVSQPEGKPVCCQVSLLAAQPALVQQAHLLPRFRLAHRLRWFCQPAHDSPRSIEPALRPPRLLSV